MAEPFIPDRQIVLRARMIAAEYSLSRLQIVAARPGNPMGATFRRIGGALALKAPPFGTHLFNRAYGFSDADVEAAADIIDWYAASGGPSGFEIIPGMEAKRLTELLHQRGYRHTDFHATVGGLAKSMIGNSGPIEVRPVKNESDLAAFTDVYHRGWNFTAFRVPTMPWLDAPGWLLYLGLYEGQPAGAAILYLHHGDAYLADGTVDPAFRNRGVHRALLDRRCAEAMATGAKIIYSGAEFLSSSHRNMLREGLVNLCTVAIWAAPARSR